MVRRPHVDLAATCRELNEIAAPPIANLARETLGWLQKAGDDEDFCFAVKYRFWSRMWRLLGGGELRRVDVII